MPHSKPIHAHAYPKPIIHTRSGLPAFQDKIRKGLPVTVAFLGGSITEGAGASDADKTSWRGLTQAWLEDRHGADRMACINAGVGGTDSTFGAHRLQEHVLEHGSVDLLFVEFSVNDGTDRSESIRGMEGIVRGCKRRSPQTDLCFVYTAADKNLGPGVPFNIAAHEEVAAYYGIPSVNYASAIEQGIEEGRWTWKELAPDGVHPNDEGHALYAGFAREFLEPFFETRADATAETGLNSGCGARIENRNEPEIKAEIESEVSDTGSRDTASVKGQPSSNERDVLSLPPLEAGNYEYGRMIRADSILSQRGFDYNGLQHKPVMNWRYDDGHLEALDEGAGLSYIVTGRGTGLCLFMGPDSGILEYAVNGGPFQEVNLFDDWCKLAYRPVIIMLASGSEPAEMQVEVRNTGRKDMESLGTRLQVLRILSH
ncbi:SGNH/GDSL hydrolase family protein [Paenibacillus sp. S28]|uniref:SGNH/GDSL hydrolase family protein n=1 Tax=Paenibacillus sp. S28 TaxID=2767463 RepID=UPI00190C3BF4|nr:SGNH/GDSL hydrolase family protein [Paenibacillus sp. S28]MBJ9989682.1 SGNH/GDSL hydrolase family protein [Paenibacillus sp. S28]